MKELKLKIGDRIKSDNYIGTIIDLNFNHIKSRPYVVEFDGYKGKEYYHNDESIELIAPAAPPGHPLTKIFK